MENEKDFVRFKSLEFDDFKRMANDDSLSKYQKIGFPDSYREGKEDYIVQDIFNKLGIVDHQIRGLTLLDIGPGCTDVPLMILDFCKRNQYKVLLSDCQEMLNKFPEDEHISKFSGYFPDEAPSLINQYQNKVDYIICYSVFHTVFYHTSIYKFIDSAVSLLKPGGKFLLGDIPNFSKRTRYFSTDTGIKFHQEFTQSKGYPEVNHFELVPAQIDDGVILGIIQRYRNFGFETYLLPQNSNLPMYNRREDILICRT